MTPCTLWKKWFSRGVVGVAGARALKLCAKGWLSGRLRPAMDSLASKSAKQDSLGVCGLGAPNEAPAAADVLASFLWGVTQGARRGSGDGRPSFLDCRRNRLRGKERSCVGESAVAEGSSPSDDEEASSCGLAGIGWEYLLVGLLSFSGAAKVSAPIDGRDRKVLRRKLLSLDRLLEPPLGLVGVGGISSTLDWLSVMRLAVGDWLSGSTSSSPSMLTKLPRRWRELFELPKMPARLPKLSENLDTLALNGVLGVPNWCCGRTDSPNKLLRLTRGVSKFGVRSPAAGGNDCRFEGVSGMT